MNRDDPHLSPPMLLWLWLLEMKARVWRGRNVPYGFQERVATPPRQTAHLPSSPARVLSSQDWEVDSKRKPAPPPACPIIGTAFLPCRVPVHTPGYGRPIDMRGLILPHRRIGKVITWVRKISPGPGFIRQSGP